MDTPREEQPKSAPNVSRQTGAAFTQPQIKAACHGQSLFGAEVTQDVEKMGQELRRREEMITRLAGEVQLYVGKIKGYQTLGHLYQESKQECNQYRLKYEELAAKLDTVMKRLLPEKDVISETGIDVSDRDASMTFTTAAADIPYKLGTAEPQALVEHPTDRFEKAQRPLTIKKPSDDKDLHRSPSSIEHELQQHRVAEESTENLEKGLNVDSKIHDGKSPSNSSASSPSFVCIGGSGLSSMGQTPTSDSLPRERTYSIGNHPSATVESLNDSRTLVDLLSDPSSSAELRAMASDLQRVGNRAAKIEKQARVQQVLLNELQIEKTLLEQQLQTKQQELYDFREKYSVLAKKFHQLELEKDPSAIMNSSSMQSGEWIKVKGESDVGASCLLESPTFVASMSEMNLRSQIQHLETQIAELEIMNRNLSEACDHSERARHQVFNRLMEIEEQLKDQQRDDLQRQKECDEMIFSLKKKREELEFQKEQTSHEQLHERQQRMAAEQQCLVLQDKISQLENRIHQLERQSQMNLMEGVRPPPFDLPAKKTEHSSPTSSNKKLLNEMAILQQQVTIYKEDFDQERRDRESSQSQLAEVKLQLSQAKLDIDTSHQQIKILSGDLCGARKEIIRLKEKSTQALDELKVMKGQIRPATQSSSHHFPRQLSYGQFWTCNRCTFENPGVRATCEICGAEAGSPARFHFLQESEVDLLTGRGSSSDISLREQLSSSLQDARSPRPSSK